MWSPRQWLDDLLTNDKLAEWVKDYKGQLSYGRIGGNICLLFAILMSLAGLGIAAYVICQSFNVSKPVDVISLDKVLSYCSLLALQFLGAAIGLYVPSKMTEASAKKNAPAISTTVTKVTAPIVVEKVVEEDTSGKI